MASQRSLAYLPAHQQLARFRDKSLSPVEVLQAQIAQIEAQGTINAICGRHFDEAIAAARASEARYLGGHPRPLEGVTVALKDEYDRKGWTTTAGSKVADQVARQNHPVVDKLLAAGAILHVQTTTPEFYLVPVTWSERWGVTRNPWNPACTPGGSSGGSAAALAAGMSTLATGSDMGGSIRIPAALCGLYGFKPPFGRVAVPGHSALLLQGSLGPLARSFPDLILLQNVMSGPAPGCLPGLRPKLELPSRYPAIRGWRIACSMNQGWAEIAPDVRDNTLAALKALEAAGAIIDEVDLGLNISEAELRGIMEKSLFSGALGAEIGSLAPKRDDLTSYTRYFVDLAGRMGPKDAHEAANSAAAMYEAVDERVFGQGYRALITPTVGTTDVAADYDPTADRITINRKPVDPHLGWHLASLFNLLNFMPVINVPTGVAANKVPTGLQIAAQSYDDLRAATVAAACAETTLRLFAGTAFPG
jgi:amidase